MKQRYSFLLSPTWLGWLAFCALFLVACIFLGQWQMDRRDQALEEINRVVHNYDEDPVPFSEVRGLFVDTDEEDEWTVAEATGEYRAEDMLLVRNRGHGGAVGYEQLVPFEITQGEAAGDVLIISRGWLATHSEDGGRPATLPEPPQGEVDVVWRLKPGEPAIDRDAPEGQLASVDIAEYEDEVGYELIPGAYGLMAEESPAPAETPQQLARPALDEGPHLAYSMQWVAFGLLGFVGWGYAARLQARNNDLDMLDDDDGRHAASGASKQERLREAKRIHRLRSGKLSDEDMEDAWVEEQLSR